MLKTSLHPGIVKNGRSCRPDIRAQDVSSPRLLTGSFNQLDDQALSCAVFTFHDIEFEEKQG